MQVFNIDHAKKLFEVFQTTDKSQSSVMILRPGEHSSQDKNIHESSDQVILILEGALKAEIGNETATFQEGDFYTIPAGTPHRLSNTGRKSALAFSVYCPPEYPSAERSNHG